MMIAIARSKNAELKRREFAFIQESDCVTSQISLELVTVGFAMSCYISTLSTIGSHYRTIKTHMNSLNLVLHQLANLRAGY